MIYLNWIRKKTYMAMRLNIIKKYWSALKEIKNASKEGRDFAYYYCSNPYQNEAYEYIEDKLTKKGFVVEEKTEDCSYFIPRKNLLISWRVENEKEEL